MNLGAENNRFDTIFCNNLDVSGKIIGGGGNTTSLDETLLYSGNDLVVVDNPPTIRVNYTLSDNYNNYDYIILEVVAPSAISSAVNYCTITVKMPLDSTLHHPIFSPSMYNSTVDTKYDFNGFVEFNNDNIIQFCPRFMGSDIRGIILSKVIGIKKKSLSTADIAEMAMPSDVFESISWVTDTQDYIPPANGYLYIWGTFSSDTGTATIIHNNSAGSEKFRNKESKYKSINYYGFTDIVRKGENITLMIINGIKNAVFYYSVGDAKALGLI